MLKLKNMMLSGIIGLMLPAVAFSAEVPKPTAPSVQVAAALTGKAKALVGVWKSVDAKNGALHGTIALNADKSATMQAEKGNLDIQTPLMKGTWRLEGTQLVLTLPPYGTSKMQYKLDSTTRLVLTYENQNTQTFERK